MGAARCLLVGGAVSFAVACSSVPDVVYSDVEGGANTASSSSGGTDAAPAPVYRCPDKPPPAGEGVCCGDRLCVGCDKDLCDACLQAGCAGDQSCCPRGQSGKLDCRPTC